MNRNRVWAIIKKDIRAVAASKMVLIPLIIVPALLCVLMPTVLVILALKLETDIISSVQFIEKLIPLYPVPESLPGIIDKILFIFLNYTFIPYLMLVPIMTSSVIASDSIVGEKERKTLETLLYSPVSNREFFIAKLFGAFIPAVLISWAGFAGYFTFVNFFYYLSRETLIIRSWIWAPVMLLLSPSVSLLGLSVTLLVSLKAKTYMEAQQMAGIVVLPFVVLIIVQITGLFVLKPLYIFIFSLILAAAGYLVTAKVAPRFSRESIINTL